MRFLKLFLELFNNHNWRQLNLFHKVTMWYEDFISYLRHQCKSLVLSFWTLSANFSCLYSNGILGGAWTWVVLFWLRYKVVCFSCWLVTQFSNVFMILTMGQQNWLYNSIHLAYNPSIVNTPTVNIAIKTIYFKWLPIPPPLHRFVMIPLFAP